jgi:hypothetical protein
MHSFYRSQGRMGYIAHIFLFGHLTMMETKIHVTPNHFEFAFKYSLTLHILVFM